MPVLDADQPLVLSSYCLGTTVSFAERVRVAARAGFAGIGIRAENYWDAQGAGLDDASMLEILGTHGVRLAEVEYLTDWCGFRSADQQAKEQTIFHIARTFGVPHVNAGRINLLATGATTRSPLIPNAPTIAETYPGFEVVTWYGIVAPAKTPRALVLKLNGEIARAVASPDLIARFSGLGLDPHPGTPEEMGAYLKSEIDKWSKVIRAAGVRAE